MEIKHYSRINTDAVAKHYSEKDGVDVKYVCTSAIKSENISRDIFFRETPHPQFGNRYFGIYYCPVMECNMISNADAIEEAEFVMARVGDHWEYSAHRHDFHQVDEGYIDGGRDYVKLVGSEGGQIPKTKLFKIVDGEFVDA